MTDYKTYNICICVLCFFEYSARVRVRGHYTPTHARTHTHAPRSHTRTNTHIHTHTYSRDRNVFRKLPDSNYVTVKFNYLIGHFLFQHRRDENTCELTTMAASHISAIQSGVAHYSATDELRLGLFDDE